MRQGVGCRYWCVRMAFHESLPQTIRFGLFELDIGNRELLKRGHKVKLQPRPLDVLLLLVEHAGRIVTREEIRERIWEADIFVDFERSINFAINQIRTALRDDPENPGFIETVPKHGYRFIAAIEFVDGSTQGLPNRPILIARMPVPTGDREPEQILTDSDESGAPVQPVTTLGVAPSSRKPHGIMFAILAAVLITIVTGTLLLRWRLKAPAEIKEEQLTKNSDDNPITNAAVSPDGRYFAYADLNGLHVKLFETGEVRDFAEPSELGTRRPHWLVSWLPDSARFLAVAYGIEDPPSTWQASVIGGTLRLLRKGAVAWSVSPDGTRVALTLADEREMWLIGLGSESPLKVADAGEKNWFSNLNWSPDGSRLLYIKHTSESGQFRNSLAITDLKSGTTATLLPDDLFGDLQWLRDGRIFYIIGVPNTHGAGCHYWIARLDSEALKFSSTPQKITQRESACISSVSATADGKRLYYLKHASKLSVYIADLAPGGTRISPPRHLSLTEDKEFPVAWTADSAEVILVSNRNDNWGFYRQRLDNDTATPILTGIRTPGLGAIFPRMSPDGAWLVYAPYPEDYVSGSAIDVLRVSLSGGTPQLVMRAPFYDTPRCARAPATLCAIATKNKDQLVFTGFDPLRGGRKELARMKLNDPERWYEWDLSPDNTRIAVLERGTSEIHVLSLRTHADEKFFVKGWNGLAALDWTPDGKGLFTSSLAKGSVLLHTDLNGNANVLWEPKGDGMTWAVPSPDGRHVAMPGFSMSSNVWSMRNF